MLITSEYLTLQLICCNLIMGNSGDVLGVNNTCNAGCYCHEKSYFPVCDDITGTTYITPCHAGCSDYETGMEKIQVMKMKF